MASHKTTKKVINALVCKKRNVVREYVYLENLKKFLESCPEPSIFEIVFNDKQDSKRLSFDGSEFLEISIQGSWVH